MFQNIRRATAYKVFRREGKVYALTEDHSFESEQSNIVEILLPPGLSVDYQQDTEIKLEGFYCNYAGRSFFMIDTFSACPMGNIDGTLLYHLEDHRINIQLSQDKVIIQASDDTQIILEKNEPISIKTKETSLFELIHRLLNAILCLKTAGSPAIHTLDPESIRTFTQLQKKDLPKILK
ncbi:MAG: hypothetical protein ACRC0X_02165 [Brevinema sp.]